MSNLSDAVKVVCEAYAKYFELDRRIEGYLDTLRWPVIAGTSAPTSVSHLTASALVLDPRNRFLLLAWHMTHKRWSQPGGHVIREYLEEHGPYSLWREAARETEEEVEVDGLAVHRWHMLHGIPLDISVHRVPRDRNGEPRPHWHIDLRYLFNAASVDGVRKEAMEISKVKWVDTVVLETSDLPDDLRIAIAKARRLVDISSEEAS